MQNNGLESLVHQVEAHHTFGKDQQQEDVSVDITAIKNDNNGDW